ncbi:Gfo/Idh/MocA family oxidoreductase [Hoeflea sp. G2-23]|uniref:Gfo/Idh/MocA family oxidoreductase n=1 Tax=Hoeflea algicola TaxID=2983763 RepID=A0ABT3ZD84_9HYPH|nr:Gfo/Idh/MocA family oxidoreductase [Hoeflea algicola]MCY0149752.1 Gfo/Idh/MocA family oxidoreductase [Hoeflea algicola]
MIQPDKPLRLGIAGVGKIARDEHIPSIGRTGGFVLSATASRNAGVDGVAGFRALDEMLAGAPELEAVALCTPPQVRYDMACAAIAAGKHVLLEKPPGVTLSEVHDLVDRAQAAGVTLYATWHSRHAACVETARLWLEQRTVTDGHITWREDVTHWHPGQDWIWEPGGMGVFDPGINALSILTEILPFAVHLVRSTLEVPENRSQPIAASLAFAGPGGAEIEADFDWRQKGPQTWDIRIETTDGTVTLSQGGSRIAFDDSAPKPGSDQHVTEYDRIYRRFSGLIADGRSDVDLAPFRHVADAFMLADIKPTAPFVE